jgi:hypothetical protein
MYIFECHLDASLGTLLFYYNNLHIIAPNSKPGKTFSWKAAFHPKCLHMYTKWLLILIWMIVVALNATGLKCLLLPPSKFIRHAHISRFKLLIWLNFLFLWCEFCMVRFVMKYDKWRVKDLYRKTMPCSTMPYKLGRMKYSIQVVINIRRDKNIAWSGLEGNKFEMICSYFSSTRIDYPTHTWNVYVCLSCVIVFS